MHFIDFIASGVFVTKQAEEKTRTKTNKKKTNTCLSKQEKLFENLYW